MVYFITDSKDIKIGYTKNDVTKRLKQLQTANTNKLYLLGYIDGPKELEKELHKKFLKYKKRHNGEWFSADDEIIEFINKYSILENIKAYKYENKIYPFFSIKST